MILLNSNDFSSHCEIINSVLLISTSISSFDIVE